MNGPQDVGGMTSFGPINPEKDEPLFHADWERRVLAFTVAMGATGTWNIDQSRHARETLPPAVYWSSSYYEIWLAGLTKLMTARKLASNGEVASGRLTTPPKSLTRVLSADKVEAVLAKGGPASRASDLLPGIRIGDRVSTRNIHTEGHTRLPIYARGKRGIVVSAHGTHVFPDSSAHGNGDDPQWLYTVRFTAAELWGTDSHDSVQLDLWEPYLEATA